MLFKTYISKGNLAGGAKVILRGNFRRTSQDANFKGTYKWQLTHAILKWTLKRQLGGGTNVFLKGSFRREFQDAKSQGNLKMLLTEIFIRTFLLAEPR